MIKEFLDKQELDMRIRGALPRPFDQKVTPDILCTISKALLSKGNTFSNRDIQNSKKLKDEIERIFGKPDPKNPFASNEYDKFIGQITNMMEYAGLITKYRLIYTVANKEIIMYIANSVNNAYVFMETYTEEVLLRSDLFKIFDDYINTISPTKKNYVVLKEEFIKYYYANTNITKPLELRRILPKILNILAYKNGTIGTKKGTSSKNNIIWRDLLYSTKDNIRDLAKKKNETRIEYRVRIGALSSLKRQEKIMKDYVRENYGNQSAMSNEKIVEVHHILKKSDFPEYIATPENLIPLSLAEHREKAHPNMNYSVVDEKYQLELLVRHKKHIEENPKKYDINIFNEILSEIDVSL